MKKTNPAKPVTKPAPKPPTPAPGGPPPIAPRELVSFAEQPDGSLEATISRYGVLRVRLAGSPFALEVSLRRDTGKNFRCFVTTDVIGDEKQTDAVRKANGGVTPGATYYLAVDGRLGETKHEKATSSNTGRSAADADSSGATDESAAGQVPGDGDTAGDTAGGTESTGSRGENTGEAEAGGA